MRTKYFKWGNPLFIVFLAIAGLFGVSSALVGAHAKEAPVVEEAKAEGHSYYVAGLGDDPWLPNTYEMKDTDGDGIFTYDYTMPAGNTTFAICEDGGWTTTYRYNNLLIQQEGSCWSDGSDNNVGIWYSNESTYDITICFRESDHAIMVFPKDSVPSSWKTFYILVNNDWSDWANPRLHFWGNGWKTVWDHIPTMNNLSIEYTSGEVTGNLYSISIPDITNALLVTKSDVSAQTENLDISSGTFDAAKFYYDSANKLSSFSYIPNGGYLRGVYHGGEPSWGTNIELSNDKVDEYITYDYDTNKFTARLELYAGDYFKFVQIYNGVEYWRSISSITSADDKYYPADYKNGNNVGVTNSGIYYITAGQEEGDDEWYYVDNSASAFAYEFLNSMTCDASGINPPTWIDGYSWEYFSDWYSKVLDVYAKDTFYDAAANKDGTNIENAIARYQNIVANHGYEPFIRSSSNVLRSAPSNINIFNLGVQGNNDIAALIIVISSSIALISITGLSIALIKKRKLKQY